MLNTPLSGAVTRLAAAGLATVLATGPLVAETLKLAHFVSPTHVVNSSVVDPLVKGVAEDTDGALTIEVYPGGELGAGPMEQYVRALQGVADITWGLQGYTSSQFPKTMIVEMPGAIPEGMSGYEMLWNAYETHLKDEYPGTKPLALWVSEPNIIITKGREIRTPADIKGLKIRVSGAIAGAVVEALGATPVQMPAGEIYNSLQTGLIDGLITGASAVADFKLDEVADSYTIGPPLGHISFYLVMNQARYDALPEEFRSAIDAHSGIGLSRSGEEAWNARATETVEKLRETGDNTVIELTEEEVQAFAELTLPVTDRLIAEMGAEEVLAAMRGE